MQGKVKKTYADILAACFLIFNKHYNLHILNLKLTINMDSSCKYFDKINNISFFFVIVFLTVILILFPDYPNTLTYQKLNSFFDDYLFGSIYPDFSEQFPFKAKVAWSFSLLTPLLSPIFFFSIKKNIGDTGLVSVKKRATNRLRLVVQQNKNFVARFVVRTPFEIWALLLITLLLYGPIFLYTEEEFILTKSSFLRLLGDLFYGKFSSFIVCLYFLQHSCLVTSQTIMICFYLRVNRNFT